MPTKFWLKSWSEYWSYLQQQGKHEDGRSCHAQLGRRIAGVPREIEKTRYLRLCLPALLIKDYRPLNFKVGGPITQTSGDLDVPLTGISETRAIHSCTASVTWGMIFKKDIFSICKFELKTPFKEVQKPYPRNYTHTPVRFYLKNKKKLQVC